MKSYLSFLDFTKVLGLYLMILGHGNMVSDELRVYIYSFHMPLFFIISGLLTKDKVEYNTLKVTTKSLLVPYIIMNIICLMIFIVSEYFKGAFDFVILKQHLFAILLGVGYDTHTLKPVCTPMWFFYSLFIVKNLYAVLPKGNISKIIQVILCVAFVMVLKHFQYDTYIPVDSALLAYPFFIIGTSIRSYVNYQFKIWHVIIATAMLIIAYFVSKFNGRCDIDTMRYGRCLFLFIYTGTVSTISILVITSFIGSKLSCLDTWSKIICEGAPIIVGLNIFVIHIFKSVLSKLTWNNIYGILGGILIMLMFYPVILLSKRYFPSILGYRK